MSCRFITIIHFEDYPKMRLVDGGSDSVFIAEIPKIFLDFFFKKVSVD